MRRFRFRAERLLRMRHQRLRMEQVALARALARHAQAEQSLQQARQASRASLTAMARLFGQGELPGQQLLHAWQLCQLNEQRQASCQLQLEQARNELSRAREQVVAAHRAVRVLERWRQRQRARFEAEQARQERRLLDELTAVRWWHGGFGNGDAGAAGKAGR